MSSERGNYSVEFVGQADGKSIGGNWQSNTGNQGTFRLDRAE